MLLLLNIHVIQIKKISYQHSNSKAGIPKLVIVVLMVPVYVSLSVLSISDSVTPVQKFLLFFSLAVWILVLRFVSTLYLGRTVDENEIENNKRKYAQHKTTNIPHTSVCACVWRHFISQKTLF